MGSGKTVCGRLVANKLHYRFYDLDHIIEKGEHKAIPDIFTEDGEEAFRKLEQKYLDSLTNKKKYVLSLGGGTICKKGMPGKVKEMGLLFYLNPTVDVLAERLKGNRQRPLLKDDKNEMLKGRALESRIRQLLAMRQEWYRLANYTIEINAEMTVEDVAGSILTIIKKAGLPV